QTLAGLGEPVRDRLVDELAAPAGGGGHQVRGQLGGGDPGDAVHQVVRLVDHDRVVLGEHRPVLQCVDRQQSVVGHDDVRAAGLGPGPLGEAVGTDRAAGGAQA